MSKKYYVRKLNNKGCLLKLEEIDLDYWAISLDDIDEHDEENTEYVTDRYGKILGVAWEMEL